MPNEGRVKRRAVRPGVRLLATCLAGAPLACAGSVPEPDPPTNDERRAQDSEPTSEVGGRDPAAEQAFALCYEQETADGSACSCWSLFMAKHLDGASPAQRLYAESQREMCEPAPDPPPAVDYPEVTSGWKTCFREFAGALQKANASTLPYTERLSLLGRHCGTNLGMLPMTNVMTGTQYQQDGVNVYQLHLDANTCYSILAAGDEGVRNLDMALRRNGRNVAKDTAQDNYPSVGYCATETGAYQILIAVQQGRGHYAVQVWRRPVGATEATKKPTLTVSL